MFEYPRRGSAPPEGWAERGRRWRAKLLQELTRFAVGSGERRVRLHTLTLIRWIAVVGQAFTILLVHVSLGFTLPLLPLLSAVILSAVVNLALSLRSSPTTRLTERSAALLLGYDILQLAFLLALTGGLQNPFSVLLLVPVTISATILSLKTTVILCQVVVAALTLLAFAPTELPWGEGGLSLPALYIVASWTALVLASLLSAGYAWRVADEARRMADALAAMQMALAREQQLSALGGLAAAAAHELGSPLATIAITARELANSVPEDSPLAEDIAELVQQSRRCRDILRSLGQSREDREHAAFTRLLLSDLVESIVQAHQRPGIDLKIDVEEGSEPDEAEPTITPAPELKHGLDNLIQNAVQFAEREVRITVIADRRQAQVRIEDDGPGFSPEILEQLGEPYVSTRQEAGGLGLGVFIAQALLARTGARLQFENIKKGARVTVSWDRSELERVAAEDTR